MMRFMQTIKHDPDNGQWGDCYRTAIGCLLDLPPDQVPHFCDGAAPNWNTARDQWLRDNSLMVVHLGIAAATLTEALEITATYAPDQQLTPGVTLKSHYLLTGLSGRGVNHSVVALGCNIVHNPAAHWYGDDDTLLGPCPETDSWEMEYIVGLPPISVYGESEYDD